MLKTQAFPGGIIVIHDGGPQRMKTVDILNDVVPDLLRRGYTIVTLSELVAIAEPSAPPTPSTRGSQSQKPPVNQMRG
jgi:peptidoglycan/xylan/chitin deacetylase (PgdA/CDA1 family)